MRKHVAVWVQIVLLVGWDNLVVVLVRILELGRELGWKILRKIRDLVGWELRERYLCLQQQHGDRVEEMQRVKLSPLLVIRHHDMEFLLEKVGDDLCH